LSKANGKTFVTLGVNPKVENPLAEAVADQELPFVIMGYRSHSMICTMPVVCLRPMIGLCIPVGGNGLWQATYILGF